MGLDHHHETCGLRLGFILIISLFFFIISSWIHLGLVTEGRKTHKQSSGFHQGAIMEEDKKILRAQIGSKPPKCERRCSSCRHCEAIQVPTNNPQFQKEEKTNPPKLFKIAYAREDDNSNYKPMSWKCKCGNLIFNP